MHLTVRTRDRAIDAAIYFHHLSKRESFFDLNTEWSSDSLTLAEVVLNLIRLAAALAALFLFLGGMMINWACGALLL